MPKNDLRRMKEQKQKGLTKDDILKAAKNANISADLEKINGGDIKGVEETVAKYQDKNENELLGDLGEAINNGRKDGTFSDDMLDSFMKSVSPMMDSAQRKKLDGIVKMIKDKKI